jgi:hypothetical protein
MLEDRIDQYILPFFPITGTEKERLRNDLLYYCNHHRVLARQLLEFPGDFDRGQMWFGVSSIVHSYSASPVTNGYIGRQVWKKQEFILDSSSFLDKKDRINFIQVLEPGEFISIRFPDLNLLADRYTIVKSKMDSLAAFQQRYYAKRIFLFNQSALERVKQLELENPLFARIASNSIKATHVALTRQGYEKQLKKLDENI